MAGIMSHTLGEYVGVHEVYWLAGSTAIVGALDAIRTKAVGIVAEIRALTFDDAPVTPAIASQAVNIVIHGSQHGTVVVQTPAAGASAVNSSTAGGGDSTVSSAAGGSVSSISAPPAVSPISSDGDSTWNRRLVFWAKVTAGFAVVGIIVALIVAYV